jgi:IS5 family transposase
MASTPCAEGIEAIMFRTIGDGPSAWESALPPELLRLPDDLARVDALLDDPAFFAPFAPHFHPVLGRPSTPAECYLRLMFLKFRHRLGYESLCAEVSDSGQLATVLPDPARWQRAASDHADEADPPVRRGRGGRAE